MSSYYSSQKQALSSLDQTPRDTSTGIPMCQHCGCDLSDNKSAPKTCIASNVPHFAASSPPSSSTNSKKITLSDSSDEEEIEAVAVPVKTEEGEKSKVKLGVTNASGTGEKEETLTKVKTFKVPAEPRSITISPDSAFLLTGGWWDAAVLFHVTDDFAKVSDIVAEKKSTVYDSAFRMVVSHDDVLKTKEYEFIVGDKESVISVWLLSATKVDKKVVRVQTIPKPSGSAVSGCRCVRYTNDKDRSRLAAAYEGGLDAKIVLYRAPTGIIQVTSEGGAGGEGENSSSNNNNNNNNNNNRYVPTQEFPILDHRIPQQITWLPGDEQIVVAGRISDNSSQHDDKNKVMFLCLDVSRRIGEIELANDWTFLTNGVKTCWSLAYTERAGGCVALPSYHSGITRIYNISNRKKKPRLIAFLYHGEILPGDEDSIKYGQGVGSAEFVSRETGNALLCGRGSNCDLYELPSSIYSTAVQEKEGEEEEEATEEEEEKKKKRKVPFIRPIQSVKLSSSCWSATAEPIRNPKFCVIGDYGRSLHVYNLAMKFERRRTVFKLRFLPNSAYKAFEIYTVAFLVSSYL